MGVVGIRVDVQIIEKLRVADLDSRTLPSALRREQDVRIFFIFCNLDLFRNKFNFRRIYNLMLFLDLFLCAVNHAVEITRLRSLKDSP